MAYPHCSKCDWSQDDFWDWGVFKKYGRTVLNMGYNPVSVFMDYFSMYVKPRYIEFEKYTATEMGFKSNRVHSWSIIVYEFKRMVSKLINTKWRTYQQYKDSDKKCPKCGEYTWVD